MSLYGSKALSDSKEGYDRAFNIHSDDFGLEDDDDDNLSEAYNPSSLLVDGDDCEIEWAAEHASLAARSLQLEIELQERGGKGSNILNTLRARFPCSRRYLTIVLIIISIAGVILAFSLSWSAASTRSNESLAGATSSSSLGVDFSNAVKVEQVAVVPRAPAEMESACSVNSVDGGIINNQAECQSYCSLGMCCIFKGASNCFVSNSETCPDYEACTVLEVGKSPGSLGENLIPAPKNINHYCSEKSIVSTDGMKMCKSLCQPALCCNGEDGDCSSQQQSCNTYNSCRNVWPSLANIGNTRATIPSPIETICRSYNPDHEDEFSLCETACMAAMCCFTGVCRQHSPFVCKQYKACPGSITNSELISKQEVPKPLKPLEILCSSSKVESQDGLVECAKECSAGACCFADGDINCYAKNLETCRRYQPCFNVPDVAAVPAIPDPVDFICSPDRVATDEGRGMCTNLCSPAGCCVANGSDNCYEFNEDMCDQYRSCSILTNVPDAPADLFELCCITDAKNPSKCNSACEKAACCFEEGPRSCRAYNEITCESYAVCHDKLSPAFSHELSPIASACSTYSLSSVAGRIECRQECDPARCCIEQHSDQSCVDENKELCDLYTPFCSYIWSEEDEGDEEDVLSSTIARICSAESIVTESGRAQCEAECLHAACCDANGEFSCLNDNRSWCKEYSQACKILDKP